MRTLVKSPPELWAQCSDVESLARHLHAFGEIRITRLEPETAVAWEGERASGTVRIEPSGWGTKVTLTAAASAAPQPAEPPPPEPPPPEPPPPEPASSGRRRGLLGWLMVRRGPSQGASGSGAVSPPAGVAAACEGAGSDGVDPGAALDAALDSLGQAHRRPFSRG